MQRGTFTEMQQGGRGSRSANDKQATLKALTSLETYEGKEKPPLEEYLYAFKAIMDLMSVPEDEWAKLLVARLRGNALTAWRSAEQQLPRDQAVTFADVVSALQRGALGKPQTDFARFCAALKRKQKPVNGVLSTVAHVQTMEMQFSAFRGMLPDCVKIWLVLSTLASDDLRVQCVSAADGAEHTSYAEFRQQLVARAPTLDEQWAARHNGAGSSAPPKRSPKSYADALSSGAGTSNKRARVPLGAAQRGNVCTMCGQEWMSNVDCSKCKAGKAKAAARAAVAAKRKGEFVACSMAMVGGRLRVRGLAVRVPGHTGGNPPGCYE